MQAKPSRTVIVNFFNEVLELSITKIDDLGNGAAYCQIFDSLYGDVPIMRVKFDTRIALDMQQNYKILQQVFIRHRINYDFDPIKLMKCRFQDNLDFSQWVYQFWHQNARIPNYDPVARRSNVRLSSQSIKTQRASTSSYGTHSTSSRNSQDSARSQVINRPQSIGLNISEHPIQPSSLQHENQESVVALKHTIENLEKDISELSSTIDIISDERTLYFEKLVEIEQLTYRQLDLLYGTESNHEAIANNPILDLLRNVQAILFSTPEGFQLIDKQDEPF